MNKYSILLHGSSNAMASPSRRAEPEEPCSQHDQISPSMHAVQLIRFLNLEESL